MKEHDDDIITAAIWILWAIGLISFVYFTGVELLKYI